MKLLADTEIVKIDKIGSSMRGVLSEYNNRGASVYLAHHNPDKGESYFSVELDGIEITLLASNLNFYSSLNSLLAQKFTSDKWLTFHICRKYSVPTPDTIIFRNDTNLNELLSDFGLLVVKPLNGSHGDGITTDIRNLELLNKAIRIASDYSKSVLIQQMVQGDDYRLLFLDYKLVSVVQRKPPFVIGDGKQTIIQLINGINIGRQEFRTGLKQGVMKDSDMVGSISNIPINEVTEFNGVDFMGQVPNKGQEIRLLSKANVSLGGQAVVVEVNRNTQFIKALEKMLLAIDLPICGVDVMSTSLENGEFLQENTFVIEFNAAPGFRLHEFPYSGRSFPVSKTVADLVVLQHKKLQNIGL